ncbi:hypothetical protein McanMca71_000602 [Microsporum canis]|uniref:Aminoglycoside phosphotransferase domain-containing protein n=1 Tax=Arthroderma otae (strain ATCC MYA-4605 / CBS 113480) TaxID=554155 RepID=C5FLZ0_ARTOC|nr:conserved hypothetical protein [Microsporum canis CBS 113480]EEQ30712.1 conserved hypothetical protein [Microsporum canis CBS 113480]
MNVDELDGDLWELHCDRSSFEVPNYSSIRTDTAKWKLGPIFSERETYDEDDELFDDFITEVAGVCVATQVEGPTPGVQGIAKIRMQIPNDYEIPAPTKPQDSSYRTATEVLNLKELTERGSTCTPKLLDLGLFEQTRKEDPLPGGFMTFIVMERLPGRNLVNFDLLPMSERDQVRLAFAKAIREFYAMGCVHDDPDRRNLMWDPENKKCYIIDLEDVRQLDSDVKRKTFTPELDFHDWAIAGPEVNTHLKGLDPMVPYGGKYIEDPGDEALEKMAKDAAGKELLFLTYRDMKHCLPPRKKGSDNEPAS